MWIFSNKSYFLKSKVFFNGNQFFLVDNIQINSVICHLNYLNVFYSLVIDDQLRDSI